MTTDRFWAVLTLTLASGLGTSHLHKTYQLAVPRVAHFLVPGNTAPMTSGETKTSFPLFWVPTSRPKWNH